MFELNKNFNLLDEQLAESGIEMSFDFISAGLAVAGAAFGLAGSSSSDAAAKKNQKNANKFAKQQYKHDKREAERTNKYNQESLKIAKQNYNEQRNYEIATQNQNWQRSQYIQDFEFNTAKRAYQKSEATFGKRVGTYKKALGRSWNDAQQGLNEFRIGQDFDKQDLNLRTMQGLGTAQAGMQAGNNLVNGLIAQSAQKGRDLAVMNASLRSAANQAVTDMGDYSLDYQQAVDNADAARLIKPEMMNDIPKPLIPPERVFQDPYEVRVGPEPIDGVYAGPGIWGSLSQATSALAGVNWSGITAPSGGGGGGKGPGTSKYFG